MNKKDVVKKKVINEIVVKSYGVAVLEILKNKFPEVQIGASEFESKENFMGYQGSAVSSALIECLLLDLPQSYTRLNAWRKESVFDFEDLLDEMPNTEPGIDESFCSWNGLNVSKPVVNGKCHEYQADAESMQSILEQVSLNEEMVAVDLGGRMYFTPEYMDYLKFGVVEVVNTNHLVKTFSDMLVKSKTQGFLVSDQEMKRVVELIKFQSELAGRSTCLDSYVDTLLTTEYRDQFLELLSLDEFKSFDLYMGPVSVIGDPEVNLVRNWHCQDKEDVYFQGYRFMSSNDSKYMELLSKDVSMDLMSTLELSESSVAFVNRQQILNIANKCPGSLAFLKNNYERLSQIEDKYPLLKYLGLGEVFASGEELCDYLGAVEKMTGQEPSK
ncbi:hypothetical protein [Vibrio barjaei]|uniref:hypothetical protein n=1 Tax=Vibrio barjaei TaxID=1676683 RepID=UPI0022840FEF|nr:hypothetical protein [Vibrio barjaei]MCY9870473.1 hypothetical protein [Vibrio barjaei]